MKSLTRGQRRLVSIFPAVTFLAALLGAIFLGTVVIPASRGMGSAGETKSGEKAPPLEVVSNAIINTPADQIMASWHRAQKAQTYSFSADLVQYTIPVASVTNVGQSSREDSLHMEGQTNLRDGSLFMKMWSKSGNLMDPNTAFEFKYEDGKSYLRRGNADWQPVDNFMDTFAPQGDFMTFLDSAKDVTRVGTESRSLDSIPDLQEVVGSQQPAVQYTRYTYHVDGAKFALQMRDLAVELLEQRGELPPGLELEPSEYLQQTTGDGEFWVSMDGLPLRQVTILQFPEKGGSWTSVEIKVRFYNFGTQPETLAENVQAAIRDLPSKINYLPTVIFMGVLIVLAGLAAIKSRSNAYHSHTQYHPQQR